MFSENQKAHPLVSILVLSFNQAETIKQTLDSVCFQKSDFPYEVLIGDDASTDGTREICEAYIAGYDGPAQLRLCAEQANLGLIGNFKRLISTARGKYVSACAGDDYWTDPNKIQKQARFLEAHADVGLVYTLLDALWESTGKIVDPYQGKLPSSGMIFDELLKGNFIAALTTMFRRDLAQQALIEGLFDRGFKMEDYPLWLFINERYKTHLIPEKTVVWRKQIESVSNSRDENKLFYFDLSVMDVQLFFAKRNNKMALIKDDLLYLLRQRLAKAYREGKTEWARALYQRLTQVASPFFADRLMLWGSRPSVLRSLLKILNFAN